jgi:hypothetical protein
VFIPKVVRPRSLLHFSAQDRNATDSDLLFVTEIFVLSDVEFAAVEKERVFAKQLVELWNQRMIVGNRNRQQRPSAFKLRGQRCGMGNA